MPKPPIGAARAAALYILEPSEEQEKAQGFTNKMEEYAKYSPRSHPHRRTGLLLRSRKNIDEYDEQFSWYHPDAEHPPGKFEAITADDLRAAEERDEQYKMRSGSHKYRVSSILL